MTPDEIAMRSGPDLVEVPATSELHITMLRKGSVHLRVLVILFVMTLPLVNPWVRGDGVGYYAYIHALLIHHDLNFESEWRAGNSSFTMSKLDANGRVAAIQYTA